jgi:hypothetical protein
MRCLTKAIAVAGLGFYIYQGEDVPKNSEENKKTTGVQSTSTVLLQESKDTDSQSPQLDILKTIIPFGKEKGKTYGEVITTPEELTKSIKYWESHWKTQKAKEDALLHLGNLKRLRDSQIVQGVA